METINKIHMEMMQRKTARLEKQKHELEFIQKVTTSINKRLMLKFSEDNIRRAICEIPHLWMKRKSINKRMTSYGMKHVLERYRRTLYNDENPYISNEDFIEAMNRLGYNSKRCPGCGMTRDVPNPNFCFNMDESALAKTLY